MPDETRKQRRAAARNFGHVEELLTSSPNIKLAMPDRSGATGKTLLDLYEERKNLLDQGRPFDVEHLDGPARDEDEPVEPAVYSIFWALVLGSIHFTFDVLVHHQYLQDIEWISICFRTATTIPVLFVLIWIMSCRTAEKLGNIRQLIFFLLGVGAGCHTIHITNRHDYYGVMKQTPPVATLWIWTAIEMNLPLAATSVGIELAFLWWRGYTLF